MVLGFILEIKKSTNRTRLSKLIAEFNSQTLNFINPALLYHQNLSLYFIRQHSSKTMSRVRSFFRTKYLSTNRENFPRKYINPNFANSYFYSTNSFFYRKSFPMIGTCTYQNVYGSSTSTTLDENSILRISGQVKSVEGSTANMPHQILNLNRTVAASLSRNSSLSSISRPTPKDTSGILRFVDEKRYTNLFLRRMSKFQVIVRSKYAKFRLRKLILFQKLKLQKLVRLKSSKSKKTRPYITHSHLAKLTKSGRKKSSKTPLLVFLKKTNLSRLFLLPSYTSRLTKHLKSYNALLALPTLTTRSKISPKRAGKSTKRKKFVDERGFGPSPTPLNNFRLLKNRSLSRTPKILNYNTKRFRLPIKRMRNFILKINHYKLLKSKTCLRLILTKIKAQYSVNARLQYPESLTTRTNWEYSNPYLFMNVRGVRNLPPFTLIDSFVHNKLQPFTIFQARNSKAQLLSHKKLRQHVPQRSFISQRGVRKLRTPTKQTLKQRFKYSDSVLATKLSPVRLKAINHPRAYRKYLPGKICTIHSTGRKRIDLPTRKSIRVLRVLKKQVFKKKSKRRRGKLKVLLSYYYQPSQSLNVGMARLFNTYTWKSSLGTQPLKIPQTPRNNRKVISKFNRFALPAMFSIARSQFNLAASGVPNPTISKHIPLNSATGQPFVLRSPIIFLIQFFVKNHHHRLLPKYVFKKKIFSFLKPNEVKQALMERKRQVFSYKLVFNRQVLTQKLRYFSPTKLKQLYNTNVHTNLLRSKTLSFNHSTILNRFHEPSIASQDILNNEIFDLRGTDQTTKRLEIKIPRIRFKPGYQRMWRRSRIALKEALGVKFSYQKKLTRYVVRFFRQSNYYAFSWSEMALDKVIVYSRLLPDLSTLRTFTSHRLVYLNGVSVSSFSVLTFENDLIQLLVSKWYYAAYRWISNWTIKRVKKYKRLVYRKGLSSRYKLMKQKKQKSFYTPNWIHLTRYDISDIKPYLEVDYLTLSAVIVYNPYLLDYHSPKDTPDYRPTIYRLYNWKYIT